jgi:outer membrane protein assembly factor BamB
MGGMPGVTKDATRREFLSAAGLAAAARVAVGTGRAQSAGTLRWEHRVGSSVISSPTVVGGTVYIGNFSGAVIAVDAETGDRRWQFETPKTTAASPTVIDGIVYAVASAATYGGSSTVHAIDAETGTELWRLQLPGLIRGSPTVADGTVYIGNYRGDVGDADGVVVAVDADTGAEEWRVNTEARIKTAITVVSDTVYVPAGDLLALSATDGTVRWRYGGPGAVESSPTVAEGAVFLGTGESIAAVEATDGSERWRSDVGGRATSTPTVTDGTVLVGGGNGGGVYALATTDGSERWRAATGTEVHSSPTVANGVVYVGTGERSVGSGPDETATSVYAYDLNDGTERWRYETDGSVQSSPTVADGTVFVGSSDGSLYAIATGHNGASTGSRTELGTLGHHDDWRGADTTVSVPAITVGQREHVASVSVALVTLLAFASGVLPGTDREGWHGTLPLGLLGILGGTAMATGGAVLALPAGAFPAWQLMTTPIYDALAGGPPIRRALAGITVVGWVVLTLGILTDYRGLTKEHEYGAYTSRTLTLESPPAATYAGIAGVATAVIVLDLGLWFVRGGGLVPWLSVVAGPPLLAVAYLLHRLSCFDETVPIPSAGDMVSRAGSADGPASGTGPTGSEPTDRSAQRSSSRAETEPTGQRQPRGEPGRQSSEAPAAGRSPDTGDGDGHSDGDAGPPIAARLDTVEQRLQRARRRRSAAQYDPALDSCREAIETAADTMETAKERDSSRTDEVRSRLETARRLQSEIEEERSARQRATTALEEIEEALDRAAQAIEVGQPVTGSEALARVADTFETSADLVAEHQFSALEERLTAARKRRRALQERAESVRTGGVPDTIPAPPQLSLSYTDLQQHTLIGSGGSADVYGATVETGDGELSVAVKEPQVSGDTVRIDVAERITDEASRWQQLDDHDHVVSVIGYGTQPLPWIAMEYMDGGDLRARAGELSLPQALWTALSITEAIYHASDRGVVHLDLKPGNILFREVADAWDIPKVADWGLSRHLLDESDAVEGLSIRYAAPEQVTPDAFGAPGKATDVYQLGAVFYELFSGHPPFSGDRHDIVQQITAERPPPPSAAVDIPEQLDEIIMEAMSTDPGDRYEDVLYLRDDLRESFEAVR